MTDELKALAVVALALVLVVIMAAIVGTFIKILTIGVLIVGGIYMLYLAAKATGWLK